MQKRYKLQEKGKCMKTSLYALFGLTAFSILEAQRETPAVIRPPEFPAEEIKKMESPFPTRPIAMPRAQLPVERTHVTQPSVMPMPPIEPTPPAFTPEPPIPAEAQVPETATAVEEMIAKGIHTVDVEDEGNWVLKRIWWEQAEDLYEKIVALNDQVANYPMSFVNKKAAIDKQIEDTFKTLGTEQIEIAGLIQFLLDQVGLIEQEDNAAVLLPQEKELLSMLSEKKKEFEQIKADLESLAQKDSLLNEALMQIMSLVNECRQYELRSWKNFKEIARVLNDEKAKELFYQIDANYKNIQAILNYLQKELDAYTDSLMEAMREESAKIVSIITELKTSGFDIKQQVTALKELEEEKKRQTEQATRELAKPKKEPKKGFFGRLGDWFGYVWKSIKQWFKIW